MSGQVTSAYRVREARQDDNEGILQLLADNPQPGPVNLAFERSPDYFHGASVSSFDPAVFVIEQPDQKKLVGVYNIGSRDLFVNGDVQKVHYAHDFRIDPKARGGEAIFMAYDRGRRILETAPWTQAVILADNEHYLRSVRKRMAGLPAFYAAGDIRTSLLTGRKRRLRHNEGLNIRMATRNDLGAMQAFYDGEASRRQFAPVYRFADVAEKHPYYRGLDLSDFWLAFDGDELVGLAGSWDQKGFRQTRVAGYNRSLKLARPLYNGWSRMTGGMRLPATGECFNYRMIHTVMVREQDPLILDALLSHLHRCYGPYYDALICAFFEGDAAENILAGFSRRVMHSHHFLMTWGEADPTASLDAGLPLHADVARL